MSEENKTARDEAGNGSEGANEESADNLSESGVESTDNEEGTALVAETLVTLEQTGKEISRGFIELKKKVSNQIC